MILELIENAQQKWHHDAFLIFCALFLSVPEMSIAQTYEVYVGDEQYIPGPNPPMGSIDYGLWSSNNSNVGLNGDRYGATVYVNKYFSGTAILECEYAYTYWSSYTQHYASGHGTQHYYVKAKASELRLNETEVTIEPGDEIELTYKTVPSGLHPHATWSTSNEKVAWIYNDHVDSYDSQVTIMAGEVGDCVITCNGNTGMKAPTCIVHVRDDRPHVISSVSPGLVPKGTIVELSCDMENAEIHYTTDRSDPTKDSPLYTSPIELTSSKHIWAKAWVGNQESRVTEFDFNVRSHNVGDIFKYKTVEGVELTVNTIGTYKDVDYIIGTGDEPAIDKNYTGAVTIPHSIDGKLVQTIAKNAFKDCSLSSINLDRMCSIGANAFEGCQNLRTLYLPSVFYISSEAFKNCTALETIVIRHGYFSGNTHATRSTAERVFQGCKSLKKIYTSNEVAFPSSIFDDDIYNSATLYVPSGAVYKYKNRKGWNNFKNIVEMKQLKLITNPAAGSIPAGTRVKITSPDVEDAEIYWLTETEMNSNPHVYVENSTEGILVNESCTIIAYGNHPLYSSSDRYLFTFKVEDPKEITSITLPIFMSIDKGKTANLQASVIPSRLMSSLVWKSSNTSVATVSSSGQVKGVTRGTAVITATSPNGAEARCTVEVNEQEFVSLGEGKINSYGERPVEILQCKTNPNLFRVMKPFNGISKNSYNTDRMSYTENSSEWFDITLLKKGDIVAGKSVTNADLVYFTPCKTGLLYKVYGNAEQWMVHPSWFPSMADEKLWIYNRVVSYQEDGLPKEIALSEYAYYPDLGGGNNYTQSDKSIEIIFPEYREEQRSVTLSSEGYATFYDARQNFRIPSGLTAQIVTKASNNRLTYMTIAEGGTNNDVIHKGTAVMLVGKQRKSASFVLSSIKNASNIADNNLLRGSDVATTTTGDGYHYKLSYGQPGSNLNNVFGWYWGAQNGAPFQIEGHKAWLVVPKSSASTRGFAIGGEATGIEMVSGDDVEEADAVYYDLQGRRVTKLTVKGVYIKNGKKVMVK